MTPPHSGRVRCGPAGSAWLGDSVTGCQSKVTGYKCDLQSAAIKSNMSFFPTNQSLSIDILEKETQISSHCLKDSIYLLQCHITQSYGTKSVVVFYERWWITQCVHIYIYQIVYKNFINTLQSITYICNGFTNTLQPITFHHLNVLYILH